MIGAKVEVLLFTYRGAPAHALMAINAMMRFSEQEGTQIGLRVYGNALVHRARNTALAQMRPGSTHLLFVDDDMVPPADALEKLLADDRPVVSAICTTRGEPCEIAAKVYDESSDQFVKMESIGLDRLVEAKLAVGAAFLLMRREAIEAVMEYHLSARDWLDENRRRLNHLKVRTETREAERERLSVIRRANMDREKFIRVFDFPIIDNEMQLGEDIALCRKLLNLRMLVAIDTRVVVGHLGEYPYCIWDVVHSDTNRKERIAS